MGGLAGGLGGLLLVEFLLDVLHALFQVGDFAGHLLDVVVAVEQSITVGNPVGYLHSVAVLCGSHFGCGRLIVGRPFRDFRRLAVLNLPVEGMLTGKRRKFMEDNVDRIIAVD